MGRAATRFYQTDSVRIKRLAVVADTQMQYLLRGETHSRRHTQFFVGRLSDGSTLERLEIRPFLALLKLHQLAFGRFDAENALRRQLPEFEDSVFRVVQIDNQFAEPVAVNEELLGHVPNETLVHVYHVAMEKDEFE